MQSKYSVLWKTDEANYSKGQHRDAAMRKLAAGLGSRGKWVITCWMQPSTFTFISLA